MINKPHSIEVDEFKNFVNGDTDLRKEDQVVIVLRKICFYVEIIGIYLRKSMD